MHEIDRYRQLRLDRELIEAAARQLRHDTVQDEYRGRTHPEYGYGCASILDEVALRLVDVHPAIRARAVEVCRQWGAAGT
jgi:hypothetical protein